MQFDEGFQLIWDILTSPALEKNFKSVKILNAETLILLSNFLQLPTKAFANSKNIHNLEMNSALAILMKSVSICKVLLKYVTEKETPNGYGNFFFYFLQYAVISIATLMCI